MTDSGVALRGYELGLRQVKDQFLRVRREHFGDDSLELRHRSDIELTQQNERDRFVNANDSNLE